MAATEQAAVKVAVSSVTYWVDRPYTYLVPERLKDKVCPGMRVAVPFGGNRPREGVVLAYDNDVDEKLKLKYIQDTPDEEPIFSAAQLRLAAWMRERFFCTIMDALRAMVPSGLWYDISEKYTLAESVDEEAAYAAAGRSAAEKKVLDVIIGHKGICELSEIEAVFTTGNPAAAISSLVKKNILVPQALAVRRGTQKKVRTATLAISPQEAMACVDRMRRAPRQTAVLRLLAEIHRASVSDICYFTGTGREAIRALADKGLITISNEVVYRRPEGLSDGRAELPSMNAAQNSVFTTLRGLLYTGKPQASLLYGVTGSGKTTVYIHLID